MVLIALKGSQKFPYVQNLDPKLYIYSMYYKNSNIPFCFWADWAVRAVMKLSANLPRYLNSGTGFLYHFHGQKK